MSLGQAIKKARLAAKVSQAVLAERLDVSQQWLSHIETDRASPTESMLAELAEVIGTTIKRLRAAAKRIERDPSLAPVQTVGRPRAGTKRPSMAKRPKRAA